MIDLHAAAGKMPAMKLTVIAERAAGPWYAEGLSFTCSQCGNCCTGSPGYVWISPIEIDRLAEFLELPRKEVISKYCRRLGGRYSLNEQRSPQGNYDCVFLHEEKVTSRRAGREDRMIVHTRRTCTIYPVRPLQCRTWPFWEGNLASPQHWRRAAQRCPGMGRGREYSLPEIEALRDAEDWPQKPPTSA
jgi:Fe-S-cluster containining protein